MADKDDPKKPFLPPHLQGLDAFRKPRTPTDPIQYLKHPKLEELAQQYKPKADPSPPKPDIKAKAAETLAAGLSDGKKLFERAKQDAPGLAENAAKAALKAIGVERHTLTARDKFARFLRANWKGVALFAVGTIALYLYQLAGTVGGGNDRLAQATAQAERTAIHINLGLNLLAALGGFIIGFLPVLVFSKYRDVALALIGLLIMGLILTPSIGGGMAMITGGFAAMIGLLIALWLFGQEEAPPNTFGSSRWATFKDIEKAKLTEEEGIRLGIFDDGEHEPTLMHYAGDRHLLTCAPTRSGKGTSAIIPNLLTYDGSVLVIDPKGENALITAKRRAKMGHKVMLLDPWDLAASTLGTRSARLNPVDWLIPNDPDLTENAMLIADALIQKDQGTNDPFWTNEAKALVYGYLLYLATDPHEEKQANLGRLRQILTAGKEERDLIESRMLMNDNDNVRAAANRIMSKSPKERASVFSSAQSQTHFLESARLQDTLSATNFRFEMLKKGKVTVYLILPADRLETYGRWLRLMVQQAITVNARDIETQPKKPILFLLDEMAALGHLASVEQAFGLMAGFGMQLWGIVQDLSQLKRIYGHSWETFIGNSGVLQYFGSRDNMTAGYFSKLCGAATVWNISFSFGGGNKNESKSAAKRELAMPDELMTMKENSQLLIATNTMPIIAKRVPWHEDPVLKPLGVNLHAKRNS